MDAIEMVSRFPAVCSAADAKHELLIHCGGDNGYKFNTGECKELLDSLLQNKELETLVMHDNYCFGSLEACRELGKLVQTSTTLENLFLYNVGMRAEGLRHIVEGILNNPQSALEGLDLSYNELGLHHVDVSEATDKVGKDTDVDSLEGWRALGQLIGTSATLKHLCLQGVRILGKGLKFIVEGILNNSKSVLETLDLAKNQTLSGRSRSYDIILVGEGVKQLCDLLFANPGTFTTLDIRGIRFTAGEMQSVGKALASNTTLINLSLGDYRMDEIDGEILINSLKCNRSIHKLTFYYSKFITDHAFKDFMGILQGNYTVKDIEFPVTDLKKEQHSQLKAMLFRNRRLGEYLNTLHETFEFGKPTIGRLFLCGSPFAGKTTLRTSMVNAQPGLRKKAKIVAKNILEQGHVLKRPNDRTKGIEVRRLKTPTGGSIAIWDMAGQEEYRALHDNHYLFPEMSQAFVYLFVFGPLEEEQGRCKIDAAALQRLQKELYYWLSFINSNSGKAEVITPKVFIALTHLDKLYNETAESYVAWAESTVHDMRGRFAGQVEVQDKIHAVNSHSQKHALVLLKEVMTTFTDMFSQLPEVPAACEKVNIMLAKWTRDNKSEPIITVEKFFQLCQSNVSELPDLFRIAPTAIPKEFQASAEKSRQAVVSYLHDSGSIIHFKDSDRIVVDINWLGQTFLGQLFNSQNEILQKMIPRTTDGIVPKLQLERFLRKFVQDGKYRGITPEVLTELMKALKICEDASLLGAPATQFFMPCTLNGDQDDAQIARRQLTWTQIGHDYGDRGPVYTGLRLQCEDRTRTFLSPGLFLRYQVHLLKMLSGQGGLHYRIERNLIHVKHSGMEMFIESSGKLEDPQYGGDDDYVDILMKYYGQPMSGKQQKYPFGVSELRKFCASREGCPGVSLEEMILRPKCIKRLTPCVYRRNQAVSREELTKEMVAHLCAELGESPEIWNGRSYANTITEDNDDSKIYRHRFEAVHEVDEEWVKATTLLDDWTDVQNAFVTHQQSAIDRGATICQGVNDVQREIKIAVDAVQSELRVPLPAGPQPFTSPSSPVVEIEFDRPFHEVQTLPGPSDDDQDNNRPITLRDIQMHLHNMERRQLLCSERNKNEILDGTQIMIVSAFDDVVKNMLMIRRWQEQQIDMMQKLERITALPKEQSGMPRFPYLTRYDVELQRKIVALKVIGEAFTLHFMCEEPTQRHFVTDQKGLEIDLLKQTKWAKRLRPLISASIDIFLVLLKAAAHVGGRIGTAIPDWQGAIPLAAVSLGTESALNEIKMTDSNTVDPGSNDNAWQCLLDEMVRPIMRKKEISKEFGLYQVQYKWSYLTKHLPTSHYWVCGKCREKAYKADQLVNDSLQVEPKGFVRKSDDRYPWH